MKPIHALIACSLLGSVWLASCSSDTKKKIIFPAGGDAGEAGEPSGGSAPQGGLGGQGGGGAPSGGTPPIVEAGAGGEAPVSVAGQGGQGAEGGAPPVCFTDLNLPAAGAPQVDPSAAGASGAEHLVFSCNEVLAALNPQYDQTTGKVTLDTTALGPTVSGDFTFYYDYYDVDADITPTTCGDGTVQVNGSQLTLPINPVELPQNIEVPLITVRDPCGNQASTTVPPDNFSNCFSLHFYPGSTPTDPWVVDCQEGNCYTTCAAYQAQ